MSKVPEEFLCPITQEVMKDPVIGPDGHTYERSAITEWLQKNTVSPMTRQTMEKKDLIPNIALRNTIEQMLGTSSHKEETNILVQSAPTTKQLELSVSATALDKDHALVHISAVPENSTERKPCVFICILDVSGSMCQEASTNEKGGEQLGFSRLDLVKHSMKTIVNVLGDQDHLAIVPFSAAARIQLPLTLMNETGKAKANTQLDKLEPEGQTNIWDGLRVALDLTTNPICQNQNVVLLLLTDGEPNVNPPRGIIPTLKKTVSEKPLSCTLHTFGFGYQLDSELLNDIANIGSGTYAFIPDCTMVGTVFVNFMSSVLSTVVNRAHFTITAMNGVKIIETVGYGEVLNDIPLGSVQFGQSRDVIVKISIPENVNGPLLTISLKHGLEQITTTLDGITPKDLNQIYYQYSRLFVVDRIRQAIKEYKKKNSLEDAQKLIDQTITILNTFPSKDDSRVKALILDLKSEKEHEGGQVFKAFSKSDWYSKWGVHFIPSIMNAHILQQCNNFKDPGVQVYGGKLFQDLRDKADSIFIKLPPPKPSCAPSSTIPTYSSNLYSPSSPSYSPSSPSYSPSSPSYSPSSNSSNTTKPTNPTKPTKPTTPAKPKNMKAFYNRGGGCFDGESLVLMEGNVIKKVQDLRKGDRVKSTNGIASIVCIIKTKVSSDRIKLVELNGMKITPYHPVRINGIWTFPQDIKEPIDVQCNEIYNLVLDRIHVVVINGVECVTLGHGFTDNHVISHSYFGTERVINDLKKMKGWETGNIEMNDTAMIRDSETNLVTAITKCI